VKIKTVKCKNPGCANTFQRVVGDIRSWCSVDCGYSIAKAKQQEKAKRDNSAAVKQAKAAIAERKKADRAVKLEYSRTKRLDKLQNLVNRWVVQVRDKDKGCYTCGTTNESIKYDAGHLFTRGARSDIRYELLNIHKQCSQNCNVWGAGMRNEYEKRFINDYGQAAFDELQTQRVSLKEQFPGAESIESAIKSWRKKLRDAGVEPKY